MSRDGTWFVDPVTKEDYYIHYEDIDPDVFPQLWKPIGGFCYPADSFLRLPLPEAPFYLQNWLPKQGKAELYGRGKAGKSFLATQVARCIASGDDFLGIPTEKASVLYLQFELGEAVLQNRLRSTGKDYNGVFFGTTFSMKLDKRAGQEQFLTAVSAIEPRVVILDPFYKILSGDENEAHDVLTILNFLDEVIESFNCSILIIHHAGKDLERGGRGSSVLEGWVDSYLEIRRTSKEGEPLRCKITPKLLRHSGLPPKPLEIELSDKFEFELKDRPPTAYQKVKDSLAFTGTSTGGQLILTGIGRRKAIYDALKRLQEEGCVEKHGITYVWKGAEKAVKASLTAPEGDPLGLSGE